MKALLIYQYYGPYHLARLRAAVPVFEESGIDLCSMQIFRRQDVYLWGHVGDIEGLHSLDLPTTGQDQVRLLDLSVLLKHVSAMRPDVVFVNGWFARDALAVHGWCHRREIPRILISDSQQSDHASRIAKEYVKSVVVRGCRAAFVAGRPHERYIVQLGLRPEQVFHGCDVVDNRHFAQAQSLRTLGGLSVLTVARWEPGKNLVSAAKAFLKFVEGRPSSELWTWSLAGYGSQEAQLRSISQKSGGRIRLLGYRSYDDLPATYAEADLYWQPSLVEPWGLVVNEAMAAGLPVLVSERCGCVEDLISADVGWVFDSAKIRGLVEGLNATAKVRAQWPAMGQAASASIANWDLDRFARSALTAAQYALNYRGRV